MSLLQQFLDRYVQREERSRAELYRTEASRIRTGDRLSWALLLTGFVPLAIQNPVLSPLWIGLAAVYLLARRNGFLLSPAAATRASALVAGTGFAYYFATGDALWAFIVFLVLIAMLLVQKGDLEVEVPRLYLVAFTLFLVFSHLTLEYSFLAVLFAMVLSGVMVMLRYHFPEEVRQGRYLATARLLAGPVLLAVLVAMPIFVVFPRVPVATLRLQQAPHTGGFSEQIKFGDMAGSLESERTFMTIRTPKARKWRGIVLDYYDGKGWRRTPRQGKRLEADGGVIWTEPRARAAGLAKLDSAEVILEPTDCRFYFSPQFPIAMENEFGSVQRLGTRALMRTEDPQAKRLRYVMWFGPVASSASMLDTEDLNNYLKLLPRLPRSIAELARTVVNDPKATPRQKAERIEKYLAEGPYTYSLGAAPPKDRDPVDWFLTESKTGHCEYFSSAMVLMLRTQGVPARVVNGFNPGTFDEFAGTWTVKERNAHSWVEVYLGPEGWVEFDPTTGQGREPITSFAQRYGLDKFALYRTAMGILNRLDFEWQRYVVSFSVTMQSSLLSTIYAKYEKLETELRHRWQTARLGTPRAIATFLIVFAVLARLFRRPLASLWRKLRAWLAPLIDWLRRELARARTPREPEVAGFWADLARLLSRHGLARPPHETPWELVRRVAARAPLVEPAARTIADAYVRVAYRGAPLDPQQEAAVRSALADVERELRGSARP